MNHDPLVVPKAVDMRARLYQDRIRQGRRQRRCLVEVSRIPTRQHSEPRTDCGIRKKLLVQDTPQGRYRRLIQTEMPSQQCCVLCVYPGGFVRCRQEYPAGIDGSNREQSLEEPMAFALGRRGINTRRVTRPCCRPKAMA